jgi:cytochrome c peroxidase
LYGSRPFGSRNLTSGSGGFRASGAAVEEVIMRLRAVIPVSLFCAGLLCVGLCWMGPAVAAQQADYQWNLPKGFPKPSVPEDNPMSAVKVELGRYLFYDKRLSLNGESSCATCHRQELAFTDGRKTAIGATGQLHSRNSMSLVNVAYGAVLTWSNVDLRRLESQALIPMFGEHPVEMGLREANGVPAAVAADPRYTDLFARAFPAESGAISTGNVVKAITAFERSIISARSPYDRYHYGGDDAAVSDAAKRGEILFFSQKLVCFRCHGGFDFSDSTESEGRTRREVPLHNDGVGTGKFKTPSLRNVALTAPYMHDGSMPTLESVLDNYAAGGHDNPDKDPLIGGFALPPGGRADLIEFLRTLTDEAVTHDPRFANPR